MPAIPNPKSEFLREPNLLIPGRKPIGQVKVDWSHPITQNLVVCGIHKPQDGWGTVRNYSNGPDGYEAGTPVTADPYRVRQIGFTLLVHPSGGSNGVDNIRFDDVVGNSDDITIIQRMILQQTGPSNSEFGWRGAGSDSFRMQFTSTSNYRVTYIDDSPAGFDVDVSMDSISADDVVTLAGRQNGAITTGFTKNDTKTGAIHSNSSSGGNGIFRDDSGANPIAIGGTKGVLFSSHFYCWNRALSDSDIKSIMRDPYQLIIPT